MHSLISSSYLMPLTKNSNEKVLESSVIVPYVSSINMRYWILGTLETLFIPEIQLFYALFNSFVSHYYLEEFLWVLDFKKSLKLIFWCFILPKFYVFVLSQLPQIIFMVCRSWLNVIASQGPWNTFIISCFYAILCVLSICIYNMQFHIINTLECTLDKI